MKFLVRSSCSVSEMDWGNIALIELDQEAIDKLARYRAVFLAAADAENSLSYMVFRDVHCWWYDDFDAESERAIAVLGEELLAELERNDWVRIPDRIDIKDPDDIDDDDSDNVLPLVECRTACDLLYVYEAGFYWRAHVKYGDGADVEAWVLPWDTIICPVHGTNPEAEKTCLLCVSRM